MKEEKEEEKTVKKNSLYELRMWVKGKKKEEVERLIKEGKIEFDEEKYRLVPLSEDNKASHFLAYVTQQEAEPDGQLCTFDFDEIYINELLNKLIPPLNITCHQSTMPVFMKMDMLLQSGGRLTDIEKEEVYMNTAQVAKDKPTTVAIVHFEADEVKGNSTVLSNTGWVKQKDGRYRAEILLFKTKAGPYSYIRGTERKLQNRESFIISSFYDQEEG